MSLTSLAAVGLRARFEVVSPAADHLAPGPWRVYDALLSPAGAAPVATGRAGSEHHSDHEPA